jgi:hypothetical protein
MHAMIKGTDKVQSKRENSVGSKNGFARTQPKRGNFEAAILFRCSQKNRDGVGEGGGERVGSGGMVPRKMPASEPKRTFTNGLPRSAY